MADKAVKIGEGLYQRAKEIAQDRNIPIGQALTLAAANESIPECEVTGFCQELKKRGLSPPPEVKSVLAILDQVSPEMLAQAPLLQEYKECRECSKGICEVIPALEELAAAASRAEQPAPTLERATTEE